MGEWWDCEDGGREERSKGVREGTECHPRTGSQKSMERGDDLGLWLQNHVVFLVSQLLSYGLV